MLLWVFDACHTDGELAAPPCILFAPHAVLLLRVFFVVGGFLMRARCSTQAVQSTTNHVLQRCSAELATVCKFSEDRGASSNNTVKERRHKGVLLESLASLCQPACKPGGRVPYFLQLRVSLQANRQGEDMQDSAHCTHCREKGRRTLYSWRSVLLCVRCTLPLCSGGRCCPSAARPSGGRASRSVFSFLPEAT